MTNRIKEILKEKGYSQKELAEGIGKSVVSVSKYANGEMPSSSTAVDIANFLGVEVDDLYEKEDVKVYKSKYDGELKIGEKIIPCAVLDDGTRVITASSVFSVFERPRKGKSSEGYRVDRMPSFINANNLQPFVSEELMGWTRLIHYRDSKGNQRTGYNGRILRGLCKVYIDAKNTGALTKNQERFVPIAESILYALADVGIVALIDEATGYDKVKERGKDALQQFFAVALNENAGKWIKTFDDGFFEMIYRMRGWNWNNTTKHPSVVGIWINDIVYERLAPAILEELRKLNPKNDNGCRRYKHHQFLTTEVGHPRLVTHIESVKAICRLSGYNWERFMRNLDKAYPKFYQQMSFDFDEID